MIIACFDHLDVYTLANRFNVAELRREITQAERMIKERVTFQLIPYELLLDVYKTPEYSRIFDFPYEDYAEVCREAIKLIQANQAKTPATPGRRFDVQAIKASNDIVVVIEGYTRLRKACRNFIGCCPIHQDKNPSLTVYPDSQTWHCYGCNRGGDVFAFVMAAENTDFKGAAAILGGV